MVFEHTANLRNQFLAQPNPEDYTPVAKNGRHTFGTQITPESKKKKEIIHDPYRSHVELKQHRQNYYNPNDYIHLSPKELEEQGRKVMEETKRNWQWREENKKAQEWKEIL